MLASLAGQWLVALGGPWWFVLQVGVLALPPMAYAVRRTWQDPLPPRLRTSDVAGFLNEGRFSRMPVVVWPPMLVETASIWPVTQARSDGFWFGDGAPDAGIFVLFQVVAILCLGIALFLGLACSMAFVFPAVAVVRLLLDPALRHRRRDLALLLLFPVLGAMLALLLASVLHLGGSYAGRASGVATLLVMAVALLSPGFPTTLPWALWAARALALAALGLLAWHWRVRHRPAG